MYNSNNSNSTVVVPTLTARAPTRHMLRPLNYSLETHPLLPDV